MKSSRISNPQYAQSFPQCVPQQTPQFTAGYDISKFPRSSSQPSQINCGYGHKEAEPVLRADTVTATQVTSLEGYEGQSMLEKVSSLMRAHPVMIFSKSHCPFCFEVKRTFSELGVPVHAIEVNKVHGGDKILAAVRSMSGQKTVPQVGFH